MGNSHAIWDHTVLPATRQWLESCLYPQPKQVLDLATPEECKAISVYFVTCSIFCYGCMVAFVVFVSVLSQEIGWEERLRNDLFCVVWEVFSVNSVNQSVLCHVHVEGVNDLLSSLNIDLSRYSTELGRHLAGTTQPLLAVQHVLVGWILTECHCMMFSFCLKVLSGRSPSLAAGTTSQMWDCTFK